MKLIQTANALRQTITETTGEATDTPCICAVGTCEGWESVAEDRWPPSTLRQVATLRDTEVYEPTFEEHHPNGTRYDSAAAPISVSHFPYNRCDLWHCNQCQRHLLRYTEYGGYYIDPRARSVNPILIVD